MDLSHPVKPPGIKEDALGRRRFAGVDVSADPDIPGSFKRILSWHSVLRFLDL
jgi:hypothetical protein